VRQEGFPEGVFESGRLASLADGSCLLQIGDTQVPVLTAEGAQNCMLDRSDSRDRLSKSWWWGGGGEIGWGIVLIFEIRTLWRSKSTSIMSVEVFCVASTRRKSIIAT